jgi:HK97 family phage portal protein
VANKNGWLANLFKPRTKKVNTSFNDMVSMVGYEPNFSKFGSQVLYSNLVLSAIQTKQRFFGKLEPRHIRYEDGKTVTVTDSTVARVLRNPNHYQTTYDFLTQAYFMREKDKTCYILVDRYKTKGGYWYNQNLIVLLPSDKPELKEENNELFWVFTFDGWSEAVVFNYNDIIVWKKDIEDNQYIGGGRYSTNANADLLNSLQAHRTITESVAEASKLGCMFDGLLKVNAYGSDSEKTQAIRDKFLEDIKNNKGGLPVLDNGADYVQIQRQLKMVDGNTLKEIKENAVISTGVSIDFMTGKYTVADKEAFYESHIEPAAISLGQAMAKVMISRANEAIILYPHKVQLMATSEIVSVISTTIAAGVFKIDEYREMLGYAPLPNGEGQARPRGYNELDGVETDVGGATE